MNQLEIEAWLNANIGKEAFTPGLERIREALGQSLIDDLNQLEIVTIAGTNGKGETTLRLSKFLNQHKHCTWVSPHIERITERFVSEEGEISESVLSQLILSCHQILEKKKLQLTYYEFLFFVFCSWAKLRMAKYLLLEVGLGGRLDAVNVLNARMVLLPSISRDHQEFLGNRYDLILKEKLGVLRPGSTLIHFLSLKYLKERTLVASEAYKCKVLDLDSNFKIPIHHFSRRNQILSKVAFNLLEKKNPYFNLFELDPFKFPHRGEVIDGESKWYLYGSHNVDGVRKLIQFLIEETYNLSENPFELVVAAFSKRNIKDLSLMLKLLKKLPARKLVVTTFEHLRAADIEWLKKPIDEEGLEFVKDISSMVESAKGGKILVTGSYYFLGSFKSRFGL